MSILFPLILPLILFISGYFLTLFLPGVKTFAERVGFSIVTSIALGVVFSFLSALIKLPLGPALLIFIAVIVFVLAITARKKIFTIVNEWKQSTQKEKIFFGLFFLISAAAAVFIAAPHFSAGGGSALGGNYPWPIHGDEWWQVATVQNLIEGRPLNTHPYFIDAVLTEKFTDYKPGFSSYLAGIFGILGIDPVYYWAYLPALNIFLISLVISLLVFALTKSFWASFLVPVFLVALRSNAYVLGWWFFTPFTFSFIFVLPLLLTVKDWLRSAAGIIWAILILFALSLVYLPFGALTILALMPLAIYFLKKHRLLLTVGFLAAIVLVAALVVTLSPYKVYWRLADVSNQSSSVPEFIRPFFVPAGATFYAVKDFNFFDLVKWPLAVLAGIGAWYLRKERWALGILIAAAVGVLNLFLFWLTDAAFLVFHQRAFYFLAVMTAILAAAGLVETAKGWRQYRPLVFLIAAVFTALIFWSYFKLPPGTDIYRLITEPDLKAMAWLKNQPALKSLTVLAPPPLGTIATPLTRLPSKINLLTPHNIAAVINPSDLGFFTTNDCLLKEETAKRLGAGIIYSRNAQNCPFLEEIYRSESVFIYKNIPNKN